MFHALRRLEEIGKTADVPGGTADGEDFQAVMVVEMDVLGADDDVFPVVLKCGDFVEKAALVVVVDHGDRTGNLGSLIPFAPYQFLANQVAQGFRTV